MSFAWTSHGISQGPRTQHARYTSRQPTEEDVQSIAKDIALGDLVGLSSFDSWRYGAFHRESHGKAMEKPWKTTENHGKTWKSHGNLRFLAENDMEQCDINLCWLLISSWIVLPNILGIMNTAQVECSQVCVFPKTPSWHRILGWSLQLAKGRRVYRFTSFSLCL